MTFLSLPPPTPPSPSPLIFTPLIIGRPQFCPAAPSHAHASLPPITTLHPRGVFIHTLIYPLPWAMTSSIETRLACCGVPASCDLLLPRLCHHARLCAGTVLALLFHCFHSSMPCPFTSRKRLPSNLSSCCPPAPPRFARATPQRVPCSIATCSVKHGKCRHAAERAYMPASRAKGRLTTGIHGMIGNHCD